MVDMDMQEWLQRYDNNNTMVGDQTANYMNFFFIKYIFEFIACDFVHFLGFGIKLVMTSEFN